MPKSQQSAPPPRRIRRRNIAASILVLIAAAVLGLTKTNDSTPSVQEYYTTLESKLGYWLLLGNTRHCGLYPPDTLWPFPISSAQRTMEERLARRLDLERGSKVLDAGSGSGYVAMWMASEEGLQVEGIDITPSHVADAKRQISTRGLENLISVRQGDYHNLTSFEGDSFDGVYTMETFVHADDPIKALTEFHRVLKPKGVIVLHEADFNADSEVLQTVLRLSHCQNTREEGTLPDMLRQVGFQEVDLVDLTDEVLPLWRLFGVLGYLPYQVLKLVGLHTRFTNIVAGVETYLHWGEGHYISVRAVKP